jgi:hypothetical protein
MRVRDTVCYDYNGEKPMEIQESLIEAASHDGRGNN